jgi:hypothetical protein
MLSDGFLGGVTVEALSGRIPIGDDAVQGLTDDGIRAGVDERRKPGARQGRVVLISAGREGHRRLHR